MPPRRIQHGEVSGMGKPPTCKEGDASGDRTTTNVWDIYDGVAPLVTRTVVAHAGAVGPDAEARAERTKERMSSS
ncbi:MAG: hypothetical protein HND47_08235 [Chloroflexi bacterium]|nr:hypothetical protein [Chloroflexota bacterium]